jgi:hypothetical protein
MRLSFCNLDYFGVVDVKAITWVREILLFCSCLLSGLTSELSFDLMPAFLVAAQLRSTFSNGIGYDAAA